MEVMYAQLEQALAIQDYPPFRPCTRLVGVAKDDFDNAAFNQPAGCRTHIIDISRDHLFAVIATGALHPVFFAGGWMSAPDQWPDDWPGQLWLRIAYSRAQGATGAYYYELFANEDQVDITVQDIHFVSGPAVASAPLATVGPEVKSTQLVELSAFHVGQGMCALLHGPADGFLLDAGAGVPLRRSVYRNWIKSPSTVAFTNDLRTATSRLTTLQAIISHPDSDHWRLLDWDAALFAATSAIFMPVNTGTLALRSGRVIGKVSSLAGHTTVTNGPGGACLMDIHRSSPAVSDRNGECLVVQTHTALASQYHCLFPGDYVYDRMACDGEPAIRALSSSTFDGVMVPHHGDAASASVLVAPRIAGSTAAFFSAGTHTGYKHPTTASTTNHQAAGFLNIDRHTCTDIIEHPLP